MGTIRAALYCRVSSADRNNALQVRELTEYVERRKWELVGTSSNMPKPTVYQTRFLGQRPRDPASSG
jgi:hypothetical protein